MKRLLTITALLLTLTTPRATAQLLQDDGEYAYPLLGVSRLYSANFGEMRPDHFHSGIDIKSDGVEGKAVVAIADGYVSRIVDTPSGYGRALYIVHPDKGTTSVYAHLCRFRHDIDSMVMAKRYRHRQNSLELSCPAERYPVERGDTIGYSGNSGNSFGPHLHFEIRNTASQRTLNLVSEGIVEMEDSTPPTINALYFIATDTVAGAPRHAAPQRIALKRTAKGVYQANADSPIQLGGNSGHFILDVTDRKDGVWNRFGVWRVAAEVDGQPHFEYRMDGYTFDVTRYCNAVSYYPMQIRARSEVIRLARLDGNLHQFYPTLRDDGVIRLADSVVRTVRITAEDDCHNRSIIELEVTGGGKVKMPRLADTVVINRKHRFFIEHGDIRLSIPKRALYESTHFHGGVVNLAIPHDSTLIHLSPVYQILDEGTPLHRAASLSIRGFVPEELQPHTAIATLSPKGKISHIGGICHNSVTTANIRQGGAFWIVADTVAPRITPRFSEGADMRNHPTLTFEVKDNFSGIKEYNAYIDGKWVPLEYSPTRHTMTYRFDRLHPIGSGEHLVVLFVDDCCGNSAVSKCRFSR